MNPTTQLTKETVRKFLNWKDVISAVQTSMLNVSNGRAIQPPRSITTIPKTRNMLLTMPGYLHDDEFGALGCKLISLFPNNIEANLPSILANILLFNEKTGALDVVSNINTIYELNIKFFILDRLWKVVK